MRTSIARPLLLILLPLLALMALSCLDSHGWVLIDSDDFDGNDGDIPEAEDWFLFRSDNFDAVMIMDNALRTSVKHGGYAYLRSNVSFSTNNVTLLVDVKLVRDLARSMDVRILTNHSGGWARWIAIGYDPHAYGWSVGRYRNGEPDGVNSYETTGKEGVWYSVNVTVKGGRFDITVRERDSGDEVYSVEDWQCDPLKSDNRVYFGVYQDGSGSWEDTIAHYDNYRLYDLDPHMNKPPAWGPLPVLSAVEDVPLTYDFSGNVSDPDTPLDQLSITSSSPYVKSVSGLRVTFEFPGGVFHGEVPLRLSDGESHEDAEVRFRVREVNDPPSVEFLSPANHTYCLVGTEVNFTIRVTDPDLLETALNGELVSSISGVVWTFGGGGELSFTTDRLPLGVHRMTARASDGALEGSAWIEVRVVEELPVEPRYRTTDGPCLTIVALAIILAFAVVVEEGLRRRAGGG